MQPQPITRPYPRGLFARLAGRCIVAGETPAVPADKLRVAFDIETDALLDKVTVMHCIVIAELDGDAVHEYGPSPDQIGAGLAHLARADVIVGHNILNFDLAVLKKLCGWAPKTDCVIVDTLVVARLILPHLSKLDSEIKARTKFSLGAAHGAYSLEAFGVRLGLPKVGGDIDDFSRWTPELQARCVGDVAITKALWRFLKPGNYSQAALELEHRVNVICERIIAAGAPFDRSAAHRLCRQWAVRRIKIEKQLRQQFPGINFNSHDQIAALLESRGWIPEERTEKTKRGKITDEVLETLPTTFPEFAGLAEYAILGRRLGQLYRGEQAWLKNIGADGLIHGTVIHIGTPHSRAKHQGPNLAQVPNPKRGKPQAVECRQLFRLRDEDWTFVAADQSLLQDRGLAHYLHNFDGSAYARTFDGDYDTHWRTAIALGLVSEGTARDKNDRVHNAIREGSKSFGYALRYGVGNAQAGRIIYETVRAASHLSNHSDLYRQFFGDTTRPSKGQLERVGKQAIKRFEASTPGLQELRRALRIKGQQQGWLGGLDGRRVPVLSQHTALNFLITSSEAVITKRWLIRVYDELCARFRYGWDGDCVIALWIHDELVVCCKKEIAAEVGELMVRHAKEPAEFYGFKVPLDADYTIANSWGGNVAPAPSTELSLADLEIIGDDAEVANGESIESDIWAGLTGSAADFPGLDLLLYWITEREAIRLRREAGEPRPWSTDEIFQRPFCNVERERDRVSIWIRENWREPFRDHDHVWFLMVVARLINEPKILSQITPPLPWDKERFLAEFAAKGLTIRPRGYRGVISPRGWTNHEYLAHKILDPLWADRESILETIRTRRTCRGFFDKLNKYRGFGGTGFRAGQATTDVKFTALLENAPDWWSFVTPGPGSLKGLNFVCGRGPKEAWSTDLWHATFARLRSVVDPRIEEILGRRLSASDLQSALCELAKYCLTKAAGRIARYFTPSGEAPAQRPRKSKSTAAKSAPKLPTSEPPLPAPIAPAHDAGAVIRQMRATIRNLQATPRIAIVPGDEDKGRESYKVLCPFHDDHTPSLEVYPNEDDPHYYCWVCHAHGHLDDLKVNWTTAAVPTTTTSLGETVTLDIAHELWGHAKPIGGTLAEKYLGEVRGIDVGKLSANVDETLRFHPRCPFRRGNRVPTLLALYRDIETDTPAGIHRIALPPEVFAGAKVERLTLGRWAKPRAIKLWSAGTQLFVGEGLETVLAAATRLHWHDAPMQPAWAVGIGGLTKLPLIGGVERLIILVDNDLNGAGQAAAMHCAARWDCDGRQVVKLMPKRADTDFNDIVKETAP